MKDNEFNHPLLEWSMKDSTPLDALYEKYNGRWETAPDAEKAQMREALSQAHDEQELELDTPEGVGDGFYKFRLSETGEQFHPGIVVRDGKFDPNLTAHAIFCALAVCIRGRGVRDSGQP